MGRSILTHTGETYLSTGRSSKQIFASTLVSPQANYLLSKKEEYKKVGYSCKYKKVGYSVRLQQANEKMCVCKNLIKRRG